MVGAADRKIVIVNDDGHGGFFTDAYATLEGLEAFIEPYRGTTLSALEWGVCLGTKVNFLSDTFELFGTGPRIDLAHARGGDRQVARHLAGSATGASIPSRWSRTRPTRWGSNCMSRSA